MPKKGKKDKAAEELKRQQEEQRLLEEKLRAEFEAAEKRWRESLDEYFGSNSSTLSKETQDANERCAGVLQLWKSSEKIQKEQADWEKFLSCKLFPDPTSIKSMNIFLSMWKDEFTVDCTKKDEWMIKILELEQVADSLEKQVSIAIDSCDPSGKQLLEVLQEIRQTINNAYDKIVTETLNFSDLFPQEPDENFQQSFQNQFQKLAIWGNTTKNPRFKSIDFPGIVSSSIPKQLTPLNAAAVFRLELSNSAVVNYDASVGTIVGGLFHLGLLELPTPATTLRGWKVRSSYPNNLPKITYPFAIANVDDPEEIERLKSQFPATIQVTLPPEVNLCPEALSVCWWNGKNKKWERDGIKNMEVDVNTRSIKFDTEVFATTAFIQSRLAEYPLKSWEIAPLAPESSEVIIVLEGKLHRIEIAVRERQCRLISPITAEMESTWKDVWYTPTSFFKKLAILGLDFVGPEQSLQSNFHLKKISSMMDNVNFALGTYCRQLRFRQSQWNEKISAEKVAIEVSQLSTDNDVPTVWKTVVLEELTRPDDKDYLVSYFFNEISKPEMVRFAPDIVGKGYGSLYHALGSVTGEMKSSAPFIRTVQQVLNIAMPWAN